MITPAMRRGLLASFPRGTPLAIIAPPGAFDALLAERDDAAVSVHEPARLDVPPEAPNVVLEGLDTVDDPVALLAAVRALSPHARLFALVANAAYLPALAAFVLGETIASVRPLSRGELEAALPAAGWRMLALETLANDVPLAAAEPPGAIAIGPLTLHIDDDATLERVRPAAFLAVADPA
jgi:hypothetical protein